MHRIGNWNVTDHSIRAARGPFSRIIVGVDASPASEAAVRLAISLALGNLEAELIFCHALDVPRMFAHASRFFDDYPLALEAAQDQAGLLLNRCCALASLAGVRARSYMRSGKPVAEIAALAETLAADVVVIGNRPRGKLQRIFGGSVGDEMVHSLAIPVLVAAPNS
jgi:nucleotide-binding universal stress UspA family protein